MPHLNLTYEIFRVLSKSKIMMSAQQVADALGIDRYTDVAMCLLRLKRYGQVRRQRENVGIVQLWEGHSRRNFVYFYEITPRGRGRMIHFREHRKERKAGRE